MSSSSERQCAYFISSKASIIFWMAAFHSRISLKPSGCPCLSKSRNVTRREAIRRANVFLVFHTSSIGKSCLWLQFVVPSPFFFFIFGFVNKNVTRRGLPPPADYFGTNTYVLLPTILAVPPSLRAAFINSLNDLYSWLLPFGKFKVYMILTLIRVGRNC